MRIRRIIWVFAMIWSAVLSLNAQTIDSAFEQELKQKSAGINSIRCLFTQHRVASFLVEEVVKKGTFYFKKPENILLSYDDGDYIIMTKDWFEIKNAGSVHTTKIASNPMLRHLSSILSACMVGDISHLMKNFKVTVESMADEWEVVLIPKRGRAASKISRIVLDFQKKDMSLNLLKMEEKSGDYTAYKFYDKQFNIAIESSLFKITE